MEDVAGPEQQGTAQAAHEEEGEEEPRKKKPRKIINAKRKGPRADMGPVRDGVGAGGNGILALCLSSRRNMCVNERVMAESDREAVDAACRGLTASWVIEESRKNPGSRDTCCYFDNYQAAGEAMSLPRSVFSQQLSRSS